MARPIMRAAERVAVWHEAAEVPYAPGIDDEPEYTPKPKATKKAIQPQKKGPPPSEAQEPPQGVKVPNSNKFKTPANGLKKTLETLPHPDVSIAGPHSSGELADWADAKPDFTKTYFKPNYQDALKAHLGDENYQKLLYHMPQEHHQALTTHQQAPAPKSNKFTTPANGLKKLLETPHTETEHVTDWLAKHPGFQKTYLKPQYQDALKAHLGDKPYKELQEHLKAAEDKPEPQHDPSLGEEPEEYDLNDADIDDDPGKNDKDYRAWVKTLDPKTQKNHANNPAEGYGWYQDLKDQGKITPKKDFGTAAHELFPDAIPASKIDTLNAKTPEQQKSMVQKTINIKPEHFDKLNQLHKDFFGEEATHPLAHVPDELKTPPHWLKQKEKEGWNDVDYHYKKWLENSSPEDLQSWVRGPEDEPEAQFENYLEENSWNYNHDEPDDDEDDYDDDYAAENLADHLNNYTNYPYSDIQDWVGNLDPDDLKYYYENPDSAKNYFNDYMEEYHGDDDDEDDEEPPLSAQQQWDQHLSDLAQVMEKQHGTNTNSDVYQQWADSLPPSRAAYFKDNPMAAWHDFAQFQDSAEAEQGDDDEIDKIQELLKPVHQQQSQTLGEKIHAVNPHANPQVWDAWLKQQGPEFVKDKLKAMIEMAPELKEPFQKLYDQEFGDQGGGAGTHDPKQLAKDVAAALGGHSWETMHQNGNKWIDKTPEEAKKDLKELVDIYDNKPGLKDIYDKYFGNQDEISKIQDLLKPVHQPEIPQSHEDHAQILDAFGEPSEDFMQWFAHANDWKWGENPGSDKSLLEMLHDPENHWTQEKVQGYLKAIKGSDYQPPGERPTEESHYDKLLKAVAPGSTAGSAIHTPQFKAWYDQVAAMPGASVSSMSPQKLYHEFQKSGWYSDYLAEPHHTLGDNDPAFQQWYGDQINADDDAWEDESLKNKKLLYQQYLKADPDQKKYYQDMADNLANQIPPWALKQWGGSAVAQKEYPKFIDWVAAEHGIDPESAKQQLAINGQGTINALLGQYADRGVSPMGGEEEPQPEDLDSFFNKNFGWPVDHPYAPANVEELKAFANTLWPKLSEKEKSDWVEDAAKEGGIKNSDTGEFNSEYWEHQYPSEWKKWTHFKDLLDQEKPFTKTPTDQHQALVNGIKSVFPNTKADLDNMSVPELKTLLEGFQEHLADTPGHADNVAKLKALYNQQFDQPDASGSVQPSDVADAILITFGQNSSLTPLANFIKDLSPSAAKTLLQQEITKTKGTSVSTHLQKIYDQYFNNPFQQLLDNPSGIDLQAMESDLNEAFGGTAAASWMVNPEQIPSYLNSVALGGGENGAKAKALQEKYYGGGQQQPPYDSSSLFDDLKKIWPQAQSFGKDFGKDAETDKAIVQKLINSWSEKKDEIQPIYDKYFGEPAESSELPKAPDLEQALIDAGLFYKGHSQIQKWLDKSPEQAKTHITNLSNGFGMTGQFPLDDPALQAKWKQVYDKLYRGAEATTPTSGGTGVAAGDHAPSDMVAADGTFTPLALQYLEQSGWGTNEGNGKKVDTSKWGPQDWGIANSKGKTETKYYKGWEQFKKDAEADELGEVPASKPSTFGTGKGDHLDFINAVKNAFGVATAQLWAGKDWGQHASYLNGVALGGGETGANAKILQQEFKDYLSGKPAPQQQPAPKLKKNGVPTVAQLKAWGVDPEMAKEISGMAPNNFKSYLEDAKNFPDDYADHWAKVVKGMGGGQQQQSKGGGLDLQDNGVPTSAQLQAWGVPEHHADEIATQSPEKFKNNLDLVNDKFHEYEGHNWGHIAEALKGHDWPLSAGAGGKTSFDAQQYAQEYGDIHGIPGNTVEQGHGGKPVKDMTYEEAKAGLHADLNDNQLGGKETPEQFWGKDKHQKHQQLYDKYFGGGEQQQSQAPKNFSGLQLAQDMHQALEGSIGSHVKPETMNDNGIPFVNMDYDQAKKSLKNWIGYQSVQGNIDALEKVYDKYFGSGAEQQSDNPPPPMEWMHKHFPGSKTWDQQYLNDWWDKHKDKAVEEMPGAAKKWMNDQWGDKDEYSGGGAGQTVPYSYDAVFEDLKKADPYYFDDDWKYQNDHYSEDQIKNMVKEFIAGDFSPDETAQYKHIMEKYWGNGPKAIPKKPPKWDPDAFAEQYKEILPGSESSLAKGTADEAKAKSKLDELIAGNPGTSQSADLQKLRDHWFGSGGAAKVPVSGSKAYQDLMGVVDKAHGAFSDADRQKFQSKKFKTWYDKAPPQYRETYKNHPGVIIDDFDSGQYSAPPFAGMDSWQDVPMSGKDKYYDVMGYPKSKGNEKLPRYLQQNPPRGHDIKFPRYEDEQETLPLPPGEHFAPHYAPLPIYRVMNLNLDHHVDIDRAPAQYKSQKEKKMWVQQQNARLRRIDEILNGSASQRDPEQDFQHLKSWGSQYGLSDKEIDDVAGMLFSTQPDLYTDEKWQHLEEMANKKGIPIEEMHDLAAKLEITPSPQSKGSYDHPELGQLILDYLENTRHRSDEGTQSSGSQGGLGWHWTRAVNKMYKGVPDAGIGKSDMKATPRNVPIALSGLWTGQGEGGGHGGAYEPHHQGELEHNLRSHAPVHIRRVQIRAPGQENQGYGDWHDIIDPGPFSTWTPGRYEEGDEKHRSDYAPGEMVGYKPSLAAELDKALGGDHDSALWDKLKPGRKTEALFAQLIKDKPGKKDKLIKLYRDHFVGRPDLPTKPHERRASLQIDARGLTDTRDYLKDLAGDLNGTLWGWKEVAKEHGLGKGNPRRQTVKEVEARIIELEASYS